MQKAEAQHNHAQSQPATRKGKGASLESPQVEQIAQLEAMAKASPQAVKLVQLAATANNGPQISAQRRMMDMIHNSPRMAAQRKVISAIHNSPKVTASVNSPVQMYVETQDGKLSEGGQLLWQGKDNLFASDAKFDEANGIGGDVSFSPGKSSIKGLKEVVAVIKTKSKLENDVSRFNAREEFGSVMPQALRRLPDIDALTDDYRDTIRAHVVDKEPLPDDIAEKSVGKDLKDGPTRKKFIEELAQSAHKKMAQTEIPALRQRVEEYLKAQSLLEGRPLMPSDCRAMASYVAGFDAGSQGVDVTDEKVMAGDVYKYESDNKKAEWPFHYATVIMTDGGDHVTAENAAAKASDKFSKAQYDHSWFFEMYGTRKGQTFDDKYKPLLDPE